MPYDACVARALAALAPRIDAFRSAAAAALEHARDVLTIRGDVDRTRLELGVLGARIDAGRFAALARAHGALDSTARARIKQAAFILETLARAPNSAFVVDLPVGGHLATAIQNHLADLGRAFGLATIIDVIRSGRFSAELHADAYDHWPVSLWSARDRSLAPPLVVCLHGADLSVGAIADLLDGSLHVALAVRGTAAPARLARLITPSVFVMQAALDQSLDAFARHDGPSIAALFASDVAHFVHDPARGHTPWQRLTISGSLATPPRKRIGGISAKQQLDEWRHLEALAERPSVPDVAIDSLAPAGAADPAERLAAWLLGAAQGGAA